MGVTGEFEIRTSGLNKLKTIDLSGYDHSIGTFHTYTGNASQNTELETIKGTKSNDHMIISSENLKLVDTGAGDDRVEFVTTQTKDITINLGAGNDTITTAALTANKKFEITGGAGNDTFKVGASVADATATSYVTITDIARGDKIDFNGKTVAGLTKITTDLTSQGSLLSAVNKVLQDNSVANGQVYAFTYANETYLVRENTATDTELSGTDNLVKLAGLAHLDYFNANVSGTVLEVTNA